MEKDYNDLEKKCNWLEEMVHMLIDRTVYEDHFYINSDTLTIYQDYTKLHSFTVKDGNTLDYHVVLTTDDEPKHGSNGVRLALFDEWNHRLAFSVDDGNGDDDNISLSLSYKTTVDCDTKFYLKAESIGPYTHYIPCDQLQIGWKEYGPHYNLQEHGKYYGHH